MYDPDARFKKLVGLKILDATIDKDRGGITFHTDKGDIGYVCEADCCSYTWIESVDDEAALLGTVISVEQIPMPEGLTSEYQKQTDCVAYYGLKIITEHGRAVIDYRNDSNGYYGGSLEPR